MHIILLSGGSGKRLWPLSNEVRAKQFIKILRRQNGDYESMVQRVYGQIKRTLPGATITITTSRHQVSMLRSQLGDDISLSVEPSSRNTFPAVVLAVSNLITQNKLKSNDVIVVSPIDSYVDDNYFFNFIKLCEFIKDKDVKIALLGIEPIFPSEKYGYILPTDSGNVSLVRKFIEKPNRQLAEEYIRQGALWNSGVFVCRADYVCEKMIELSLPTDISDLISHYDLLPNTSLDFALLENEKSIIVQRYDGAWKDIGTWNTFTEVMNTTRMGRAYTDDQTNRIHIINELDIPILCLGLKDVVVVACPDGILVTDKAESSHLKPWVDKIVDTY